MDKSQESMEDLEKALSLGDKTTHNKVIYEQSEIEEADILSDLNVFSFWKEEILTLYTTGRNLPKEGIFRRALHRSNLVEIGKDRDIWSEYGLALIEEELEKRGIVIERHKSLHWKQMRS